MIQTIQEPKPKQAIEQEHPIDAPVSAVIVGAGNRSLGYAQMARFHPEMLRIVGVADPDGVRRRKAAKLFGLAKERCYGSAEELARIPRIADAVINGTMDRQHVVTSIPLLAAGYDILLEKPMAFSEEELLRLVAAVRQYGRRVMVCHVLRYTPFYSAIRQRVLDGEIGAIVNIQTAEHVSYHHMAVAYVRGKWNRRERCGSSMLLAKCCHDLDIVAWMKSGIAPTTVSSFGGLMQFRPETAPPGAGTRCLVDCPIEAQCDYSARKHYLDISNPFRWSCYTWAGLEEHGLCLTDEEIRTLESCHPDFPWKENPHYPIPPPEVRRQSLEKDNPNGRCVWRCDNNVVDHQSVMVQFADGSTATHNMVGGTSRPMRTIHLLGTRGEIQGVFDDGRFTVRHADPRCGHEYTEEVVDTNAGGDVSGALNDHGGGDGRLVVDFIRTVRGETPSLSCTAIEDSIWGHRIVFAADRAMEEHRIVNLSEDDESK